jgi:8-oxo-dGDP phosphatase
MHHDRGAPDGTAGLPSPRLVYDNPWIRVWQADAMHTGGRLGPTSRVELKVHPVGIVPVTEEGETFLVGQYRYPLDYYSWEVPSGGINSDDLLDSARRELREEAGITARRWSSLGQAHGSSRVTIEVDHLFLAEELSFGTAEPEGTELLRIRRLPLAEAYRMAMAGEIADALSIVALARAVHHLRTRPNATTDASPDVFPTV